jgi:menaquinone-9 beta-reductase
LTNTAADIIIIGAGPAGCATALALRNSGLRVILIDKHLFPRNKTCGDAIPGAAFKTLQKILPEALQDWQLLEQKKNITHSHVVSAKGNTVVVKWSGKAYNSTRMSWDNFLMNLVKKYSNTTILLEKNITKITATTVVVSVQINENETINAPLIIGCDGAYSIVKKHLFASPKEQMPAVAVRAYYQNLQLDNNVNYFYVNNKIAQSYLWIFPVEHNLYNVGFGIIPSIATKNIDVKKSFTDLLKTDKNISAIFTNTTALTKIEGFKLPLYKKQIAISTNRCMLCGDAAQLIDPIQGHGIDKAMESGRLAAMQAIQCFAVHQFDAKQLQQYDAAVYRTIGKELKRNVWLLKLLTNHAWILDIVAKLSSFGVMQKWIKKWS